MSNPAIMTKDTILQALRSRHALEPDTVLSVGNFTIERRKNTWSVSNGTKQIGGGFIPASADPSTFPIMMAIAAIEQMRIP